MTTIDELEIGSLVKHKDIKGVFRIIGVNNYSIITNQLGKSQHKILSVFNIKPIRVAGKIANYRVIKFKGK